MRKIIFLSLAIPIFVLAFTACSSERNAESSTADWVLTNGKIYTVNEDNPWAEAVVVRRRAQNPQRSPDLPRGRPRSIRGNSSLHKLFCLRGIRGSQQGIFGTRKTRGCRRFVRRSVRDSGGCTKRRAGGNYDRGWSCRARSRN